MTGPYPDVFTIGLWLVAHLEIIDVKRGRLVGLADEPQPVERFPAFPQGKPDL